MNCYKCKKIIDIMHDESIDDKSLQSVLHHIKECPSCSTYYGTMEQMLGELSAIPEKELPKGFHNRVHFALERASQSPAKSPRLFSRGMRIAAIGACSILFIAIAVSILPNMKSDDNTLGNMASDEAFEAPNVQSKEALLMESDSAVDINPDDSLEFSGSTERESVDIANEESDSGKAVPTSCCSLIEGGSMVIILDVDDIDAVYAALSEYIMSPLPETSWLLDGVEMPDEYRELRALLDVDEARYLSSNIVDEYLDYLELYYSTQIEYDDYDNEMVDSQNMGYVYIVLK